MQDRDELEDFGPDADGRETRDENGVDVMVEQEDDDEGEDLLDENMWKDYEQMPQLDTYDSEGLADEAEEDELSAGEAEQARLAAEQELERRDRLERGDLPAAFEASEDGGDDREARRRRAEAAQAQGYQEFSEGLTAGAIPVKLDAYNVKGTLVDWLSQENVRSSVKAHFRDFLNTYSNDDGPPVYPDRIREMVEANKQSLEVDFIHLSNHTIALAIWAIDAPAQVLKMYNEEATDFVNRQFPLYYENVHQQVFVRINNLPVSEDIRDLRHAHINTLVRVHGVVTRRTGVFPQLDIVMFKCGSCGGSIGPLPQQPETRQEVKPAVCPHCQQKGPFTMDQQQTVYRNYQKLTLQESPGSVPAGRLPRSRNVILLNDLIDVARPGEDIEMTGIYQYGYEAALNAQAGFPVFATYLEAVHVKRRTDSWSLTAMTDERVADIQQLARDKNVSDRIIDSIAPSIYGHRNIKACIALALFGGQEKHVGSHRLRGDLNVLLIGDPGTAKSQFLKYVEKTATRSVYTTGKGASAVGLTATVTKDPITREWTLEGGALVLADRGICLIDEFDKMNENVRFRRNAGLPGRLRQVGLSETVQDRVSIHEAMEQQTISISKAGIVTALQARCSVIAAANPDNGRYDPSRTFNENVRTLTDPIISRFDCLCVVKDQVDAHLDERLATFVVASHHHSHPADAHDELAAEGQGAAGPPPEAPWQDANLIDQDLLKLYIAYAKMNCHPKLQDADTQKMVQVYTELRREAGMTHAMPVAVRHLESMIRMAEAHARMHLRDKVEAADIDIAIRLMLESFVQAQKFSVQKQLRHKFQRFLAANGDSNSLLLTILRGMVREADRLQAMTGGADGGANVPDVIVSREKFEERAQDYSITNAAAFYNSRVFAENRFRLDEAHDNIVLAR